MNTENSRITFTVEMDEDIYCSIQNFLNINRNWDFDGIIEAGMSLFLLEHYDSFVSLKAEQKLDRN